MWAIMHGQLQACWRLQKLCITLQPVKVGAKLSPAKSPIDIEDASKSSDPVTKGPQIEDQVDGTECIFLDSKTSHPICHSNSYFDLGVMFRNMHADSTEEALAMPPIPTVTHYYKCIPRTNKIEVGFLLRYNTHVLHITYTLLGTKHI